jgi:hypothetical protein
MRTMQMPPPRASTLHSFAMVGEPGMPSVWAAHFRGGSHAVTGERISMPGPKFIFTATGLPSRSSNSGGTNHDEIPGPVAMAPPHFLRSAADLDFDLDRPASGRLFLHAHEGALGSDF